jgi:tripeptidyl-peptidase-1
MEIADPTSGKYGQHMSAKEVGELFRPSSESIESVRDWLHSSGIDSKRHRLSLGQGWLKFYATVEELESILSTEYHVYHHTGTKKEHIGCDVYHVPSEIHPHIDFITPTISTILINKGAPIKRGATKQKRTTMKSMSPALFSPTVLSAGITPDTIRDTVIPCYSAVTPSCLRGRFLVNAHL